MIPVWTTDPAYRAAIATLAASARRADSPGEAIAVVTGVNWCADALRLRDEGARAIIVADPAAGGADQLDAVADVAAGIPMIVERALLRPDLAADARALAGRPSAITVDVVASPDHLPQTVLDAVGWARVLAGDAHDVRGGRSRPPGVRRVRSRHGVIAASTASGVPVSFAASTGSPSRGLLRITALGVERCEVLIDPEAGVERITHDGAEGSRSLPRRYEASARLALRRALEAAACASRPHDLTELIADRRVALELLPVRESPLAG